MITEQDILDQNLIFYKDYPEGINHPIPSKEYLAVGTRTVGTHERVSVISLIHYEDNNLKITNFFNQPLFNREYFFIGEVKTVEELKRAIELSKFKLTKLKLEELHEYN